jgi:hypothetical protein
VNTSPLCCQRVPASNSQDLWIKIF